MKDIYEIEALVIIWLVNTSDNSVPTFHFIQDASPIYGDHELSRRPILLDGRKFMIVPNLWWALCYLCPKEGTLSP